VVRDAWDVIDTAYRTSAATSAPTAPATSRAAGFHPLIDVVSRMSIPNSSTSHNGYDTPTTRVSSGTPSTAQVGADQEHPGRLPETDGEDHGVQERGPVRRRGGRRMSASRPPANSGYAAR